jgi:hypothetical protein
VGVASGVAQLADFPTVYARLVLLTITLASLLYFFVRIWKSYWVQRVDQLRSENEQLSQQLQVERELFDQELETQRESFEQAIETERELWRQRLASEAEKLTMSQIAHKRYIDAIERISDREKPLYKETLDVTVWIGTDDDSDRIVERRSTTPDPLVTHRSIRPIVTTSSGQIARMDDVGFTVKCDEGSVTPLPLREEIGRLRVWLVFEPALTAETSWTAEYRPRSLWHPLREVGFDHLVWEDRLQVARESSSALTEFTVQFLFPYSSKTPTVQERSGFGILSEVRRIELEGRMLWSIVWCDSKPNGRKYVWDLIQETKAAADRPADMVVVPSSRAASP